MAGESETILLTRSNREKVGRQRLLARIVRWQLWANVTWPQLRNTYTVILWDIENNQAAWGSDFNSYQYLLHEKVQYKSKEKQTASVWFCRNYQRAEGCTRDSPHMTCIGYKDRQVLHICAKCWLKDRVKRGHPKIDPDCPNREHWCDKGLHLRANRVVNQFAFTSEVDCSENEMHGVNGCSEVDNTKEYYVNLPGFTIDAVPDNDTNSSMKIDSDWCEVDIVNEYAFDWNSEDIEWDIPSHMKSMPVLE